MDYKERESHEGGVYPTQDTWHIERTFVRYEKKQTKD